MPLPIPQQVLAQPVTSYYKGKAIRQQLAQGEKELELMDEKHDFERRRVEVSEGNLAVQEKEAERLAKVLDLNEEKLANIAGADNLIGIASEYEARKEENPEAALEWYAGEMESLYEAAEGEDKEVLERKRADGWTEDDLVGMRAEAMAIKGQYLSSSKKKDGNYNNWVLPDGTRVSAREGSEREKVIAENLGGTRVSNTPSDSKTKPDTAKPISPPTRAKAEIVSDATEEVFTEGEYVKPDGEREKYSEYGFSKSTKADINRWVADAAERIQRIDAQRNRATGYADAVDRVSAELAKFINPPVDPGFFSNDEMSFTPPPYNIGDVIMGDDGQQYIVTGYNEQGGPRGEPVGD